MSRKLGTEKVTIVSGRVTTGGGTRDVIVPALPGTVIGIKQIIASNQVNSPDSIIFYDGADAITPNMTIGASGTLILDELGGDHIELTKGSGLFASTQLVGDIEVFAYYVAYDENAGITKVASRTASLSPTTTRAPNRFGGQSEG